MNASAVPGVSYLSVYAAGGGSSLSFGLPFTNASSFGFAAPTGADRVLVLAYDNVYSPPASVGSTTLAAAKNFDNQAVPGAVNGGNPVVLGAADETTPVPITYGSLPAGFALQGTTASLVTSAGVGIILAAPATARYPALPAGATEGGDYYSINTIASNGAEVTSVTKTSPSAVSVAFTFPAGWSYAGPTPASVPAFDVAYPGFSGANGVSYLASWNWWPSGWGDQYITSIHATGNYLSGATSITLPDLSAVTGFLAPPASGTYVDWTVVITQTTYATQALSPTNSTVTSVGNYGIYKVP